MAMLKYLQANERAANLKMAIVSPDVVWNQPQAYFGIINEHLKPLKMETGTIAALCDTWSKVEGGVKATKLDAKNNTIDLSNGKKFTYKSLVLGTGFDHDLNFIPGLKEFDEGPESNNVFVHQIDCKKRIMRNFYNGWFQRGGDYINYSPAAPYKGEGTDFYALYYEAIIRGDKLLGVSAAGSKIQYWSPNKFIYSMPYANEVALEECAKRGIEVNLGWELQSMRQEAD